MKIGGGTRLCKMLLCLIPFNCNSNIKGHTFLDRNSTVSFPNCNQKDIKSELMYRPTCFCCMMMSCSERAQFVFCTILTWHRVMRCPQTPLACWKMTASQNSNSQKLKTQDPHHLPSCSGTVLLFWILDFEANTLVHEKINTVNSIWRECIYGVLIEMYFRSLRLWFKGSGHYC